MKAIFYTLHHSAILNTLFRIIDFCLATINKNIAVCGLIVGVIITALNVCLRTLSGFGFNIPSLTWGEEIARYCFIWSALFGAAYGFRNGVHISVMMIIEKIPKRLAKLAIIFANILGSIYLGFMAWAGYMTCMLNYDLGFRLESFHNVSLWYFLLCLPLAFLGATYRVIEKLYESCWIDTDTTIQQAHNQKEH